MTLPLIAASLFLLFQNAKGSIEGTVVNATTNKPIAGAQVSATKIPNAPPAGVTGRPITTGVLGAIVTPGGGIVRMSDGGRPVQIPSATTDNSGHFVLPDLEPGRYALRATANGYPSQEYLARPGSQTGMTAQADVTAGQVTAAVMFHLTPGGTVSGRVTGSNGEPLVNMEVVLLRSMYDPGGLKTMTQTATAQTNDKGEYRLFWVPAGRYYLSAATSNRPMPGIPFNPGGGGMKYPRMFFPGTTDSAGAVAIDLRAAGELNNMDFRFIEQPTYRVRGRLNIPAGEAPPRAVSISIGPRDPIVNMGSSSSGLPYNPVDNTFELRDVPSGSYMVRAQLPVSGPLVPGQPFQFPPIAMAPVDVAGRDVDGVVLTFEPPASIAGHVRWEDESTSSPLPRVSLFLRPLVSGNPPPRPLQWNADGTFKIDGVLPGSYAVTVNAAGGPQANTYVKEVRLGSEDILSKPLTVSGPVSDGINIVLARNGGQIDGIVRNDSQPLSRSVVVVLVPNQRDRHDLYKVTNSDSAGRFTYRTVPPGLYKVFAWEDIESNSWLDPAVLGRYEERGTSASMRDSSTVTVELKVIPSPNRN